MSLEAVFDAIAGLDIQTVDVVPTVYNFDSLPEKVDSEQLPVRMLTPMLARDADPSTFSWTALGKSYRSTRVVQDVVLVQPVAEGQTIGTVIEDLVQYVDQYETVAKNNRSLGLTQAHWTQLEFSIGVIEYTGVQFFGINATWTVEDYGNG